MFHKLPILAHLAIISCVCCPAFSGCAVQQIQTDHDRIRTALLDLYTNQIIDNLSRAYKGLPIIQLDYTNATAVVTVVDTETVNDSVATTASKVVTNSLSATSTTGSTSTFTNTVSATPSTVSSIVAATTAVIASAWSAVSTRGVVNTFTGSAAHSNTNQVALTATPVTTSNEVYDHYIYFLGLGSQPENSDRGPSLLVTDEPPAPGAAQICKKCGKIYYWVPIQYQKEFFHLALKTTAQRGLAVPSPDTFPITLMDVEGELKEEGKDLYKYTITFTPSIPNDGGTILFTEGGNAWFPPYQPEGKPEPSVTNKLSIYFDFAKENEANWPLKAKSIGDFKGKLKDPTKPVKASVYVRSHRPPQLGTIDLLDRMSFQFQQSLMNQQNPVLQGR